MAPKSRSAQVCVAACLVAAGCGAPEPEAAPERERAPLEHVLVAGAPGSFAGWPANNTSGQWSWDGGRELLIGLTWGEWFLREGHNLKPVEGRPYTTKLARSTDAGRSWTVEDPEGFVGDGGEAIPPPGGIDFSDPGFALRVVGIGYHGASRPRGAFFHSRDRGRSWSGPYGFGGLVDHPELAGTEITSRTDYVVLGPDELLLLMSARAAEEGSAPWKSDRVFAARTRDGGASFGFAGWVVPPSDPHRAVMPASIRLPEGRIVTALRRRDLATDACWVEALASDDGGESWAVLGRIGETGHRNGNPPALARLADGRLAAAWGNREALQMQARLSSDGGATWGPEVVLRDDFQADEHGDPDFGYPRLFQRPDGRLVVTYYWATAERPHQHIAATIWDPGAAPP